MFIESSTYLRLEVRLVGKYKNELATLGRNIVKVLCSCFSELKQSFLGRISTAALGSVLPTLSGAMLALVLNELVRLIGHPHHGLYEEAKLLTFMLPLLIPCFVGPLDIFFRQCLWLGMQIHFDLMTTSSRRKIDVAKFEEPKFNDLLNRANERGVFPAMELVDEQFNIIPSLIVIFGALATIICFDWTIIPAVLPGLAAFLILEIYFGKVSWDIYGQNPEERRKVFDIRDQLWFAPNIREARAYQNDGYFYEKTEYKFRDFEKRYRAVYRRALKWKLCVGSTLAFLGTLYAWHRILALALDHTIQPGTAMFLLGAVGQFEGGISGFFMSFSRQFERSLYVRDIFAAMETKSALSVSQSGKRLADNRIPLIEFEGVSFRYPTTGVEVLRNINLRIEPGERIACIGTNGAGKSTLLGLLQRDYDPTEGRILVDGIDLRDIDLESWKESLGILFQSAQAYRFEVDEVVALGRRNGHIDYEQVFAASTAANAHSFIRKFPHHYHQELGTYDNGTKLSGGEWQKLAIARAFYRDPKVLMLDEPTSSIDPESVRKIFEHLQGRQNNQTIIYVSHQLSTIRQADRICLFDGGRIAECGTHDELLRIRGKYYSWFELERQAYA
jgi:ATP-binding cassette subfamily B protein